MRVKTGAGERMRTEIIQQPDAITATLAAGTDRIRALADQLRKEDICNVLLVARGTSDNAAMYGRYAFSITLPDGGTVPEPGAAALVLAALLALAAAAPARRRVNPAPTTTGGR